MQHSIQPLDDLEIEELDDFLLSDQVSEEALDFIALHGFLTALSVAPTPIPAEQWLPLVFDGEPRFESKAQEQRILGLIEREFQAIGQELYNEEELSLPCDLTLVPDDEEDDEVAPLTLWAQGFMEAVFIDEAGWFGKDEERVAELLLPMMMASELFDEPEFEQMRDDPKLSAQLCDEIPEVITDLYLFYRVPEETAPAKRGGKPSAKGGKQAGKSSKHAGKYGKSGGKAKGSDKGKSAPKNQAPGKKGRP